MTGLHMFPGALLFDIKATHGLPLDFAIDALIANGVSSVDWPGFIERARECGWYDFQTFRDLSHAMEDSSLSKPAQKAVLDGFKRYVLANPMAGVN